MQWTDRIRQIKILLVISAVIIAVTSLLVSHYLVKDLSREERKKMEVWAEALHALNHADETTDLSLVLDVMQGNTTIPVIVLNENGGIDDYRNIEDTLNLEAYAKRMRQAGDTIIVGSQIVCYDESLLLKRLSQYPYWQLGIVMIFVVVAIFALLSSKKAEQNLKENHPDDELIPELDKDVKRLERIAERFSKIGSLPEPKEGSMNEVLAHVVDYMSRRTSNKVEMVCHVPEQDVIVRMNSSLFEWVVENLCKNAVDAMEGNGRIDLSLSEEGSKVILEVKDTGKGIRKKDIKNVFTPGFTTKQRGWGLGLSLAKRIVEEYHKGRIFVKSSELGKGTTFRVELPR